MIDVPYFNELAATKIFDEIKSNLNFLPYLPDLTQLKRPPNRQYMFNVSPVLAHTLLQIVNTIDPTFFMENIRSGYEQRKHRHADKHDSKIEMSQ